MIITTLPQSSFGLQRMYVLYDQRAARTKAHGTTVVGLLKS
jgi:hypothetical protein